MKKGSVLLSSMFSMLLVGSVAAYADDASKTASPSIAVINVQQIFQQSPKIDSLNKKMQDQFKDRQNKLIAAQKDLQDERDKLDKDGAKMSAKDKNALQKKVSDDEARLSKDASSFQKDLRAEQGKVMKNVLNKLNDIVTTVAKKNNYSMVLDSQAVVYGGDRNDITKQVEDEFNK